MVHQHPGDQLRDDGQRQHRGGSDAWDTDDGHGDKKRTEQTATELPPVGLGDATETSLAGGQGDQQQHQRADRERDGCRLHVARLLRQPGIDRRLHRHRYATGHHQDNQHQIRHQPAPSSWP